MNNPQVRVFAYLRALSRGFSSGHAFTHLIAKADPRPHAETLPHADPYVNQHATINAPLRGSSAARGGTDA